VSYNLLVTTAHGDEYEFKPTTRPRVSKGERPGDKVLEFQDKDDGGSFWLSVPAEAMIQLVEEAR
jgi:hypothetical protein